jgi:hypothetical protein
MSKPLADRWVQLLTKWLMKERPAPTGLPLSDFERLRYEIRPCDVLLVEGQSRVSDVIRMITQSPWTHAVLYIGRLHDIENPLLRQRVHEAYHGDEGDQLVIESLLGKGTIVSPLSRYQNIHMRICRPQGISRQDAQRVIGYAIGRIGVEYDVRQILDLARLLIPWSFLPRRWRSSLFQHKAGESTRQICSSLLAEAFGSVHFPILPVIQQNTAKGIQLIQRNPRLYTPSDFDYSPYFEIIKYPFSGISENGMYRSLPWTETDSYSNDDGSIQTSTNNTTQKQVEPAATSATNTETTPTKKHWFSRKKTGTDEIL